MGRHFRLVLAVFGVLGAAALVVLRQSTDADGARPLTVAAPLPMDEANAHATPRQPLDPDGISEAPARTADAVAMPAVRATDSAMSTTSLSPPREVDESSEQFRHSRRGDGQHAE